MSKKLNNADEPNWGLFYREQRKDLNQRKSIKVKLPLRQHIRLHAMKLFTEKNISETVEKALDQYFSDAKNEEATGAGVTGPVGGTSSVDAGAAGDLADGGITADDVVESGVTARHGATRVSED